VEKLYRGADLDIEKRRVNTRSDTPTIIVDDGRGRRTRWRRNSRGYNSPCMEGWERNSSICDLQRATLFWGSDVELTEPPKDCTLP
jgi:hypothetical protein